jgi:hypothetical protein
LVACDRTEALDLATRALAVKVGELIRACGPISPDFKREHTKGFQCYKHACSGSVLNRPCLRTLAELEDALEDYAEDAPQRQSRQQLTEEVLGTITRRLPGTTASMVAQLTAGDATRGNNSIPVTGSEPWKPFAVTVAAVFLSIIGVASLPTTITYGGNAWWSAILPLACVVFLAWPLLRHRIL